MLHASTARSDFQSGKTASPARMPAGAPPLRAPAAGHGAIVGPGGSALATHDTRERGRVERLALDDRR